jgi:hypothetical protein
MHLAGQSTVRFFPILAACISLFSCMPTEVQEQQLTDQRLVGQWFDPKNSSVTTINSNGSYEMKIDDSLVQSGQFYSYNNLFLSAFFPMYGTTLHMYYVYKVEGNRLKLSYPTGTYYTSTNNNGLYGKWKQCSNPSYLEFFPNGVYVTYDSVFAPPLVDSSTYTATNGLLTYDDNSFGTTYYVVIRDTLVFAMFDQDTLMLELLP